MGTNHFGHFVLTTGLLPALRRAFQESGRYTRVVNLSSCAHAYSDVDINDPNYKTREYNDWQAYGQSKTANVLFSVGLTNRYAKEGIFSNAVMPGVIQTNLARHVPVEDMSNLNLHSF